MRQGCLDKVSSGKQGSEQHACTSFLLEDASDSGRDPCLQTPISYDRRSPGSWDHNNNTTKRKERKKRPHIPYSMTVAECYIAGTASEYEFASSCRYTQATATAARPSQYEGRYGGKSACCQGGLLIGARRFEFHTGANWMGVAKPRLMFVCERRRFALCER